MLWGLFSVITDLLVLNILNSYTIGKTIIFPMFSLIFVISSIYFKKNIKTILLILIIYMSILGIFYYILAFFLAIYYYIDNGREINLKDYIKKTIICLFMYDFLFFLILYNINLDINLIKIFIFKEYISIPINLFYSYFLFSVLKRNKMKYKLV